MNDYIPRHTQEKSFRRKTNKKMKFSIYKNKGRNVCFWAQSKQKVSLLNEHNKLMKREVIQK